MAYFQFRPTPLLDLTMSHPAFLVLHPYKAPYQLLPNNPLPNPSPQILLSTQPPAE